MMRILLRVLVLLCVWVAPAHAKVETLTSPSGVSFWFAQDTTQPVFTLRLVFTDTGFAYDPEDSAGLATLVTSMLTEGAGEMDALAFKQALDSKAIKLSLAADADHVFITVTSLSEHQSQALNLLTAMLTHPRFDAAALTRVKSATLATLARAEEEPGYVANRAWSEHYFGAHPYAKPRIGTKAGIESIGVEDLNAYVKRSFTSRNLVVSVAGDIDIETLGVALDGLTSALPSEFTPAVQIEDAAVAANHPPEVIQRDIPQTVIQFGGPGLKRSDPKYITGYVLNEIVGGSTLKSRLGDALREKSGLTYTVGTDLTPMQHTGLFWGAFATRNDKVADAMAIVEATIKNVAEKGVTEKELADAKAYITGSFPLSLDTNAELAGFMTGMQIYHLGSDYLEKRNALINAVTKHDVDQLAKEMLKWDAWQVVQVGAKP